MDAFGTDFRTSPNYSGSGRGTRVVDMPFERVSHMNMPVNRSRPTSFGLGALLSPADRELFNFPWFFGVSSTMHGAGPEFAFLGSLKWQCAGARQMICATYKSPSEFMKHMMPQLTQVVQHINNTYAVSYQQVRKVVAYSSWKFWVWVQVQ